MKHILMLQSLSVETEHSVHDWCNSVIPASGVLQAPSFTRNSQPVPAVLLSMASRCGWHGGIDAFSCLCPSVLKSYPGGCQCQPDRAHVRPRALLKSLESFPLFPSSAKNLDWNRVLCSARGWKPKGMLCCGILGSTALPARRTMDCALRPKFELRRKARKNKKRELV